MPQDPTPTREMIDLYDDYTHISLDRRGFMDALARMAGGTAAAAAILPLLEARAEAAGLVPDDDPGIRAEEVAWQSGPHEMRGYLVRPAGTDGPAPAVMVIHENRGLNAHIRDVTRRAAIAGFVALAPDFLSPLGGTPDDADAARNMIRDLKRRAVIDDMLSAAAYLRGLEGTNGRVGAVGFCWGGGMVGALAAADPDLDAAVVFYGRQPRAEEVPGIRARLLLHYAGLDDRINAGIADFETALKAAGTDYRLHIYDDVNHAFHNDTAVARHDPAAAELAWQRTIAFLAESLGLEAAKDPAKPAKK